MEMITCDSFRLSSDPQGRLNYGGEAEIEGYVMV